MVDDLINLNSFDCVTFPCKCCLYLLIPNLINTKKRGLNKRPSVNEPKTRVLLNLVSGIMGALYNIVQNDFKAVKSTNK